MNYEDMTYEKRAKELLFPIIASPTQRTIDYVVSYLKLEYELGGRDESKKQWSEIK